MTTKMKQPEKASSVLTQFSSSNISSSIGVSARYDKETEMQDTPYKDSDQDNRLKQVMDIQESGSEEDTENEKFFTSVLETCIRLCLILTVTFKWNPP